jgi:cystathionine gamma-synthase
MPTPPTPSHPLCHAPLWREEDLGKPIPDSPHATSVALPRWRHVVAYEEGDPDLLARLHCGYPRFVFHATVRRLFAAAETALARPGERCIVFPSAHAARRGLEYLHALGVDTARTAAFGGTGLHALVFPEAAFDKAKSYWQHFGAVISSRRAQAELEARGHTNPPTAITALTAQIAAFAGVPPDSVLLYPSGMAAMSAALRAAQRLQPGAKSIQIGFPYVDGLKIQSVIGPGVHFFPRPTDETCAAVAQILAQESISAVFCEVPGNPLLNCINVPRLSTILRPRGVPLVLDDTIATFHNVDLRPYADLIVSSLTKAVSGVGDVMAGSLVLPPSSPLHGPLHTALAADFEPLLWHEDAAVLAKNCVDFPERMDRINHTCAALCAHLRDHPAVAQVYYPEFSARAAYDAVRRPQGGYGGLFSIVLKDAPATPRFYDALRVCKGPSLGTNYTLACPFTLLAHYRELDWAEAQGVSRWLVRVSTGLETAEDLIARFDDALQS